MPASDRKTFYLQSSRCTELIYQQYSAMLILANTHLALFYSSCQFVHLSQLFYNAKKSLRHRQSCRAACLWEVSEDSSRGREV